MRILVIGSGGREHAIVWKLQQCANVDAIIVTPGNGGMAHEGVQMASVAADNIASLVRLAQRENIDLVVPGPELPLTLGIVDAMQEQGIACFGPDAYGARLEGSKAFAKEIMQRAGVPTAQSASFTDFEAAKEYVLRMGAPLVVKADGLAAGKGVVVAQDEYDAVTALDAFMQQGIHGQAGAKVVIEEFLEGEEASFLCFCDGEHAVALPSAQDHKAVYDGDTGPNTGGMGAYSPAPVLPDAVAEQMTQRVILPILRELAKDGHPFKGVLYAGLMMTDAGPKVLEYNVRFGDPECQPLLMRLDTDLVSIMQACIDGTLDTLRLQYTDKTALGVVFTAQGYPEAYPKGMEITGVDKADAMPDVKVFHSGTVLKDGVLRSNGGRVLCVTALGEHLEDAQRRAYAALAHIHMEKNFFRTDIGLKGIMRLKRQAKG